MSRNRTRFTNSTKAQAVTADDYAIHVATTNVALRSFVGIRTVRKTDGRELYSFEGAPFIGPFNSLQEEPRKRQRLLAPALSKEI